MSRQEKTGRVVHVRKDDFDVYIGRGRGSKWCNPFRIGDPHPETGEPIRRGEAIPLFKEYAVRGAGRHLLKDLGELDGQTLGCWCAPKGGVGAHDPPICHGQILLLLVEHRRRVIEKKAEATEDNETLRQTFSIELRSYDSADDLGRGRYRPHIIGDPYPSKEEAEENIALLEPRLIKSGAVAIMVAVPTAS